MFYTMSQIYIKIKEQFKKVGSLCYKQQNADVVSIRPIKKWTPNNHIHLNPCQLSHNDSLENSKHKEPSKVTSRQKEKNILKL